MKLHELKSALTHLNQIAFKLPNGNYVPQHFHVTEIGNINKTFIDCGGVIRTENKVSLQLWNANDYDHRLHADKLIHIIELSERQIGIENFEIEVEYQGLTIEKYGLEFNGNEFLLTHKQTDCLAQDKCGIPPEKLKVNLSNLQQTSCCDPKSGCC